MVDRVILTPPQDITFGGFMFDATVTETFKAQSKITSYPVETGSQITDHVTQPPREFSLKGVVTATPLDEDEVREMRIQDLFARLLTLQLSEEPLEVCSTFGYIPAMLITSVTAKYEGGTRGDMMDLSVNLKTISLVESVRVLIAQTRLEQQRRADFQKFRIETQKALKFDIANRKFNDAKLKEDERNEIVKALNKQIFQNPDIDYRQKSAAFARIRSNSQYKDIFGPNDVFFDNGIEGNPEFGK